MSIDRVESMRNYVSHVVKEFYGKHFPDDAETMSSSFEEAYNKQLDLYVMRDDSEVEGLRRLIVSFKPALSSVMELSAEFDALMTMVQMTIKASWDGAHRRKDKTAQKKKGPIMPGSDQSVNLVFVCSVCGEEIIHLYEGDSVHYWTNPNKQIITNKSIKRAIVLWVGTI